VNKTPPLSLAGIWQFNPTTVFSALVDFYSTIHLGANEAQGIVLGGWAIPSKTMTTPEQTTIAVLDQNADGTLKINTSKYIANATTNGIGSVIVTDFNGDGVDDIFLASYNERPFSNEQTIVYLSDGRDTYTKISLPDATEAHSAILTNFKGVKTVVTVGYGNLIDSFFQFNSQTGTFNINQWGNSSVGKLLGSSATIGDFLGNGQTELVVVDTHPLNNWGGYSSGQTVLYGLNGTSLNRDQVYVLPTPYFTNNPSYPGRDTHSYRVWTEDFNHDGRLDLMIAESTAADWATSTLVNASKIQMLQNQGNFVFKDMTDALGSAYATTTNNVDYSAQFLDLDHSGINSYLLGDSPLGTGTTQSNYLLLNDGTGKLYAALHDEFVTWGNSVKSYLNLPSWFVGVPKFIGYQVADGSINFVADIPTIDGNNIALVNVPVRYNITTDFTQSITVSDRNQSMIMRTWAGNDTFYDTNANATAAHLDGGLGSNTSVYSDKAANYSVTSLTNGSYEVKHTVTNSAPNIDDTLVNINRLQFTDTMVALDNGPTQNAGSVYMLYKAAFNRAPDNGGMGYWLSLKDKGADIVTSLAQGFVGSKEFTDKYGTNPSNASYVDKLYLNVLGREGEAGGVAYWNQELDAGRISKAAVLVQFATLAEGASLVAAEISHGIQYQQWVG
jgi:hypothetical protein